MSNLTWRNDTRKLADLIPQEDNPRQITKAQAERLLKSWDKFDQVETLAVGPDGSIYNGHQRYYVLLAAHDDPQMTVDVRVASRALTRREWQELTVLLHEGATGEWSFDALANWDGVDVGDLVEWGFSEEALLGAGWDLGAEPSVSIADKDYDEILVDDLVKWVAALPNIYIAFSGGKDSMATALWVKYAAQRTDAILVNYDTGIDWPETASVVDGFARQFDFQLVRIGPGNDRIWREGLARWGVPSWGATMWCQQRLKTKWWAEFAKESGLVGNESVAVAIGVRREESERRSGYPLAMWSSDNVQTFHPILEWNAKRVFDFLEKHSASIHPCYSLGFNRESCFCCPSYHIEEWNILRQKRPDLFIKALDYLATAATNEQYGREYLASYLIRMFGGRKQLAGMGLEPRRVE